jgi:hypothetical protein
MKRAQLPALVPLAAVLALLAAPARADVIVVDQANGPGTDYTWLQTAIDAAAPGDTLLVRSGDYDGIAIVGKGLTVVADDGAVVNCGPDFNSFSAIRDVPAGQTVTVRGLSFDCYWPISSQQVFVGTTLMVRDCEGTVWLEDCTVLSGGPSLQLWNSADVTVAGCTLEGFSTGFRPGHPACGVLGSTAAIVGSTLLGGVGQDSYPGPSPQIYTPTEGKEGLWVQSNERPGIATLMACTLEGGQGGDGYWNILFCEPPKNGGAAARVLTGGTVPPELRHADTTFTGGAGGASTVCSPIVAQPGPGLVVLAGSELPLAGDTPVLAGPTPTREGALLQLTLTGAEGSAAFLLLGFAPGGAFLPGKGGDLLLGGALLVLPLANVPVGGELVLSVPVPELGAGVQGVVPYLQAATCASGTCNLGTGTALLLLDAAF